MRSFILAAALALSVSAFPASTARDVSVADALVARTPQFGSFKGRGGSGDDDEDEVPAWAATIPKSSPKFAPKPAGPAPPKNVAPKPAGPAPPPKNVAPTPKGSLPPPRQGLPPKFGQGSGDEDDEESEPAPKFSAGPKSAPRPLPKAQGPGNVPSWSIPPKGDRPFPQGAPPAGPPRTFSPPKPQQPKPQQPKPQQPKPKASGPPFPDLEEDDEKIKANKRMKREPNSWEQ
jgi:hypothetical protein